LGAIVVFLVVRYQRYQRSMMVTDFQAQLEQMKEEGLVDADISGERVPRELKRNWLLFIDRLGQGQFGDVWKGLLSDGDNASIPEYMVAAKTVKEADTNETTVACETELMKEALLMAQVEPHPHLVSIIGVITRGRPKTLVLSFCEHGELGGALKKRAADGDAFDLGTKYRFCSEIAAGMAHLGSHSFVHRDLAARNVLLGSGMICKVADFGLSRRVQTEDNTGDYYRSTSGVLPVRWTAPEGLTSQKFSAASDVWSYGIVCVEVMQDGVSPYPAIRGNPEVMAFVNNGEVHPQPEGCTDDVYNQLRLCFSFDPEARPPFAALSGFFLALAPEATAGTPFATPPAGGDAQYLSMMHEQQHYLSLLHDQTGGDPDVFNALRDGGEITVDDTYSTSEYLQLGQKQRASIEKENSIVGGLDGLQISAKLGQATEDLQKHSSQYHEQFAGYVQTSSDSLVELNRVVADVEATFALQDDYMTVPTQPNPWSTNDIKVTSKRYLTRVITVFNGTGAKHGVMFDPVGDVVAACDAISEQFGTGVTLLPGPPKKEQRIMEKVTQCDGDYAAIRDLGRLSLIVEDMSVVPPVITALSDCDAFEVVRIKNRLDRGHKAVESAGYRDVQVLVRERKGGWIVEVQVIPKEMYELKKRCGHAGYTKYRFILEACKRARRGAPPPLQPPGTSGAQKAAAASERQNQHCLHLLHEHTAGDLTVFQELTEDGDVTTDDTYSSSAYMQLGAKRQGSIDMEDSVTGGLNGVQISMKVRRALEALERGVLKYRELFEQWHSNDAPNSSLFELKGVVSKQNDRIAAKNQKAQVSPDQPNPWGKEGITTSSKRYLTRVITVYNGTGVKYGTTVDPLAHVVTVCNRILLQFGARVTLVPGPPKTEERIMQKDQGEHNYAAIHDMGRLSLIVEDVVLMPEVVAALFDCEDFDVSRIKNRLDPDHAAGYRDVQVLVREPEAGWIVEVQVIPKEMYALKQTDGYTKYRFILEACKRAQKRQAVSNWASARQSSVKGMATEEVKAAAQVESRGACSRCGEAVLVTQEREVDGTGAYCHTDPADCSAATTTPGDAGAPRLKKRVSRNAVHPTDAETEA